jgi:hypothetical protein
VRLVSATLAGIIVMSLASCMGNIENPPTEIESELKYDIAFEQAIQESDTYGDFCVGSDADGLYLYSSSRSATTSFAFEGYSPTSSVYAMEYQLFVPETIDQAYYCVPILTGLNQAQPDAMIETGITVSPTGLEPYIKDQTDNTMYSIVSDGNDINLSYNGGIVKQGDWNKIYLLVDSVNSAISMSINDEKVMSVEDMNTGLASAISINMLSEGGTGMAPLRIKGIKFYEGPPPAITSRASSGYTEKNEQGYNGWHYMRQVDGAYDPLVYDEGIGGWTNGSVKIIGPQMYGDGDAAAVRRFEVMTEGGAAIIYGNFKCVDNDAPAADITIYINEEEVYHSELAAGDTVGRYVEKTAQLKTGDNVYFIVKGAGSRVAWSPVVAYDNAQSESLYHLTSFDKYYGDVFPYYDDEENKLYMGFLWTDNAMGGTYHNALEVSDNMLTFQNAPEADSPDIWQKYRENYRLEWLMDTREFIDRQKYSFGIRDHFLYHDKDDDRYLLIAGCYYEFTDYTRTSDLVIYASDSTGQNWTQPSNMVEAGYSTNLPECPSLMKIGDRWYAFVSVAYITAHQVGPLQYWTGDQGVDVMDVDWTNKDFAFLDGEDLCAARPVQVGDKVYMWGWIPHTYDTMPWIPWGGYLNLPREIVQHSDGSLGGRLDPEFSKLLNYGNIYKLGENNFTVNAGQATFDSDVLSMQGSNNNVALGSDQYHRNYVTFQADMKASDKIAYVMEQDERQYEVAIVKEDGKTYMKILSPQDESHTVNSTLEITGGPVFDVKIVTDGDIIEFFVNDEYALTGHTAMAGIGHRSYLYSDGTASFREVSVNKLIPYGDV